MMRTLAALLSLALVVPPAAAAGLYAPGPAVDTSQFATQSQLSAAAASNLATMQAALPAAGAAPPPPVNATGSTGISPLYARADHTHVSSVFKAIKQTADATAVVSWTYPVGFFTDTPVIQLTVEDSSTQEMSAKITSNTATGGTAKIIASQQLPTIVPLSGGLTLVSGVVTATNTALAQISGFNVFGGSVPVGTKLHVYAAKAN